MPYSLVKINEEFRNNSYHDGYVRSYGQKNGFLIWLNATLPNIIKRACTLVDNEDRTFTVPELKQLVKLYVVSKPWGYTMLPEASRPQATPESIASFVGNLNGYGHHGQMPVHRDRVAVEFGILRPNFWMKAASPRERSLAMAG